MPFYSFKVRSSEEVLFPSRQLAVGEGFDTFNKVIDDLPEFLLELSRSGVEVLEYNRLDVLESVQPDPFPNQLDGIVLPSAGEQHPSEAEE